MKLLIGGSPCTHWSIAQTKNRETEPSGMGWELFENYLIALEVFKPDYFLYENNKSMSATIRAEITKQFGFEPVCINSALVSAQNRQRLYWCGKRNPDGTYSTVLVQQPKDKGILLRDILESGYIWNEKSYTLKANYYKSGPANALDGGHFPAPMASEPIRIGTIESKTAGTDWDSKQYRVYSPDGKSVTICSQGGGVGAKTGLYATPIRVCNIAGGGQGNRIYSIDGKSCAIKAQGGGLGGHGQGLYALPCESLSEEYYHGGFGNGLIGMIENPSVCRNGKQPSQQYRVYTCDGKSVCVDQDQRKHYIVPDTGKETPVYEVRDGLITIKGKQYPIKLADGYYIIRKLTVRECMRLQTVPDNYVFPVSDTQAYMMLGNGWTVDVIAHILSYCQGITTEMLDVLSMYDGMACGHIALDKLGTRISRYRATEIDKYAIKTACYNFSDIDQLGDAFQVRNWI